MRGKTREGMVGTSHVLWLGLSSFGNQLRDHLFLFYIRGYNNVYVQTKTASPSNKKISII
jgi:hypothetical protein